MRLKTLLLITIISTSDNTHEIRKRDKFDWLEHFPPVQETVSEVYDFIIVGSGSSGSVIANRLSELLHWKILLLEAGERENQIAQTPLVLSTLKFTRYDWRYYMEHQPNIGLGCEDNLMPWHKGRALGGTSVIDHMIYARAQRYDYDNWAQIGNPGWSYKDVLPYFLKSEKVLLHNYDPKYHGVGGYLTVEDAYRSKISDAFIDGLNELGYPTIDYNSADSLGVSTLQATTFRGKRHSVAKAFLDPIRLRLNLKIRTKAFVRRLLINRETKEAYGVEYEQDGKVYKVGASKEVILSAGTINSPHLLLLSGIGPKKHLEEYGIRVLKDLPVGRNLQDHFAYFGLSFVTNQPVTLNFPKLLDFFPVLQQFKIKGKGPLTSLGGTEAIAYIKTQMSEDADPIPDVELLFAGASFALDFGVFVRTGFGITDEIYQKMFAPLELKHSFMIFPVVVHPKSKGYLKLRSKDPHDDPLLYGNYLTDRGKDDMDTLLAAIRFIQQLSLTEAFSRFNVTINNTPVPGCEHLKFDTEPYWRCCMMFLGHTLSEHVGTAKMGPSDDPEAVVNHQLKVYGIGKLRVADCSVIPFAIGGHTGTTVVVIGEKAADLIKSDWIKL